MDEITTADVSEVVTKLASAGKKRETIRKSVKYLAAVLDEAGVEPNPARAKSIRQPHEEYLEIVPPTAERVEAVYRRLAPAYRLPLLWLDWSGARVGSIDTLTVGDYDEPARRVRLRASTTKTGRRYGASCPTSSRMRSRRRCPHGRIARARLDSFQESQRTDFAPRSPERAAQLAYRCSRRTISVTGGSRCSIVRGARGRKPHGLPDSASCQ